MASICNKITHNYSPFLISKYFQTNIHKGYNKRMRPVFPEQQKGVRLDAQKVHKLCRLQSVCDMLPENPYYLL